MKLQEKLESLSKKPQNRGKTEESLVEEIFNSQQAQISYLRKEIGAARKAKQQPPISVGVGVSGDLVLQSKIFDKALESSGVVSKTVVRSTALGKLERLLEPLLEMAQAMIRSGGLLGKAVLKERNDQGDYTQVTLKDSQGEDLYQVNPTSRFKMLCWVLENNDSAKQAVDTLSQVLSDYSRDYLSNMSVTLKQIESPAPIQPIPVQSEAERSQRLAEKAKAKAADKKRSAPGRDDR